MKKRVALIQNRVQPGGRFQVMAEMIFVLNEKEIIPDILCFRSRLNADKVAAFYGKELKYNVVLVDAPPKLPFEWNIWWFNKKVSALLGDYDWVINHNNTSYGLKTTTAILSYIHFPRKARLMSGLKDVHFPEKGKTPLVNAGKDLLNMMRWFYRRDTKFLPNDTLIANSEFTKSKILEVYPSIEGSTVEVLYPPVKFSSKVNWSQKTKKVVSLGRFAGAKRQLEQIKIAAQLPHIPFTFIGFISEPDYFSKCKQFIEDKEVRNIKILSDASKEDLEKELKEAWFFIHSMRNEPFGITPVQAIEAGCIPVVHNSGGQKEIVIKDELRYKDKKDAVSVLNRVFSKPESELKSLSQILIANAEQFDAAGFRERFGQMI